MKRFVPLFVLLLASCSPPPPALTPVSYDVGLHDGSVIFINGGLLYKPIHRQTDSTLTHAAVVLYHGHEPWVYEAAPPCVRRMPLSNYRRLLDEQCQKRFEQKRGMAWHVMQPRIAYTPSQLIAMKTYAQSQLGRDYMLRGWWQDREVRGIHCSQYVGNVIERSGRITSANFKESPGSLCDKLWSSYEFVFLPTNPTD